MNACSAPPAFGSSARRTAATTPLLPAVAKTGLKSYDVDINNVIVTEIDEFVLIGTLTCAHAHAQRHPTSRRR